MTEQLKGKIADMICGLYRDADDPLCKVCKLDTHCGKRVMNTTDKIIAIFPDEQELTNLRDENEKLRRLLVRYKAWNKEG